MEEPFGKLLRLPTVFVNVTEAGPGAEYDFAILCVAMCQCWRCFNDPA